MNNFSHLLLKWTHFLECSQTNIVEENLKNGLPLQTKANWFNLLKGVYSSINKNLKHDFIEASSGSWHAQTANVVILCLKLAFSNSVDLSVQTKSLLCNCRAPLSITAVLKTARRIASSSLIRQWFNIHRIISVAICSTWFIFQYDSRCYRLYLILRDLKR